MTKKALIPVLALVAASIAVPAAAQNYGQSYGHRPTPSRPPVYQSQAPSWQAISQRKFNLERRIDQGERNRSLSRREANRLRSELNSLVRLERDYMRGGLTARERRDLDQRYDRLSRQVRMERNDRDNRRR